MLIKELRKAIEDIPDDTDIVLEVEVRPGMLAIGQAHITRVIEKDHRKRIVIGNRIGGPRAKSLHSK